MKCIDESKVIRYEIIDGKECPRINYFEMLKSFIKKCDIVIATNIYEEDGVKCVTIVDTCSFNQSTKLFKYYSSRGIVCKYYRINCEIYSMELALSDYR